MGALKPHDHFGGIIVPVLLQTRARTKCHLEQELPGSFLIYEPFSSLFCLGLSLKLLISDALFSFNL